MEHFAKFSTLLLHFLHISPCPVPQQNEDNHLACRNIPPVSGCLFYRLEGSHFVHRNIPPGRVSFSLVILAACGQFCYSITLLAYCLVIPSLCVFWRYVIVLTKTFPLLMDCSWLQQSIIVSLHFPSSRYFIASVSVFCAILCVPVPCNTPPWLGWSTL